MKINRDIHAVLLLLLLSCAITTLRKQEKQTKNPHENMPSEMGRKT